MRYYNSYPLALEVTKKASSWVVTILRCYKLQQLTMGAWRYQSWIVGHILCVTLQVTLVGVRKLAVLRLVPVWILYVML